jgi:hypothetical protein
MNRLQIRGRRLLTAAGVTIALAVPAAVLATMGTAASGSAAAAQYAPSNTGSPTITGTAQDGSTLTANTGTWSSSANVTYAYQWQRCNATGAACIAIAGATAQTYVVQTADVGNTLRVVVTATNPDGSTSANSANTAVVTAKSTQGTTAPTAPVTGSSMDVATVTAPNRLLIDEVKFNPSPVRTAGTIVARFHVRDTQNGKNVANAMVYAIGLPYSRVTQPGEVKTGADGWAEMAFAPDKLFPRKGYITFFVRARKAGDDVLAGVSSRRLVQLTVNR